VDVWSERGGSDVRKRREKRKCEREKIN